LFIEYTPNPLFSERGLSFPLLCTQSTFSLEQLLTVPVKNREQGLIIFL
jgi:hypothetical protein